MATKLNPTERAMIAARFDAAFAYIRKQNTLPKGRRNFKALENAKRVRDTTWRWLNGKAYRDGN